MIWQTFVDGIYPVYLFKENETHELMRERHGRKREKEIRPVSNIIGQSMRTPDEKRNLMRTLYLPFFNLLS